VVTSGTAQELLANEEVQAAYFGESVRRPTP
jgi:ABC-type lipopolysaccharide export system ATPase subunit